MPVQMKQLTLPNLPGFLANASFGFGTSTLIAVLFAMLVALAVGLIISRLEGSAATIATLGLLIILVVMFRRSAGLAGEDEWDERLLGRLARTKALAGNDDALSSPERGQHLKRTCARTRHRPPSPLRSWWTPA